MNLDLNEKGPDMPILWEEGADGKGEGHVVGTHVLCLNAMKQVTECTEWRESNEKCEPEMLRDISLCGIKVTSGMSIPSPQAPYAVLCT